MTDPRALNDAGMAALKAGDGHEAVRLFGEAAAADPKASPLWLNLANAHRQLGDAAGERAALQRALDNDQLDFMAQVRMAQLSERTGDEADAHYRWGGVIQMAAQLPATPQLAELVAHAQRFVQRRAETLATAVEAALGDWRGAVAPQSARRAGAAIDALIGRRTIYPNAPSGLHYPFLPADEYFDRSHFPWLAELEAETETIRDEYLALLEAAPEAIEPYVDQDAGTPENKWTALDKTTDWGAIFLYRYGQRREDVLARCPRTAAMLAKLSLADIPGRGPTAFFSVLKPRTRIPPHTGVSNIRSIVHLPLIVPENCGFRVGGETRAWREGEAWVFDDTIEHEAWNDSDRPRAILILDVWNPYLAAEERDIVSRFLTAADQAGFGPAAHD